MMRVQEHPDAGLLALRLGVGASFALLFAVKQAEASAVFALHPDRVWPLAVLAAGALLVTVGFCTRFVAGCMALGWAWALGTGVHAGQPFFLFPVRAALFVILFVALAFTGGGRFSVDGMLKSKR